MSLGIYFCNQILSRSIKRFQTFISVNKFLVSETGLVMNDLKFLIQIIVFEHVLLRIQIMLIELH